MRLIRLYEDIEDNDNVIREFKRYFYDELNNHKKYPVIFARVLSRYANNPSLFDVDDPEGLSVNNKLYTYEILFYTVDGMLGRVDIRDKYSRTEPFSNRVRFIDYLRAKYDDRLMTSTITIYNPKSDDINNINEKNYNKRTIIYKRDRHPNNIELLGAIQDAYERMTIEDCKTISGSKWYSFSKHQINSPNKSDNII